MNTKNKIPESLIDFIEITNSFRKFHSKSIPLCAAENIISPLAKLPLNSNLQERYIMGGLYNFDVSSNFIGSDYLYPYYEKIFEQCEKLFKADYADARPLSGMNAITALLMALTSQGDLVILSTPESGAHPSLPDICKRLGLVTEPMPYNFQQYDYDYCEINKLIHKKKPKAAIFVPSDLITIPKIDRLKTDGKTYIIYDATQTLGLIAGNEVANPLEQNVNVVLLGGTHKTIPGPTNGLIMTKDPNIAKKVDKTISPKFVRNTQMNQVACLLLTLIEMETFGSEYSKKIIQNSNNLGKQLSQKGFRIPIIEGKYSNTHQVFLLCDEKRMNNIFFSSLKYGITLNKKTKKLFNNFGIRFGVQEITRYGWGVDEIEIIAELLHYLDQNKSSQAIFSLIEMLPSKRIIHYTFNDNILSQLTQMLKKY